MRAPNFILSRDQKIPAEGLVLERHTAIDECMLTGDSMPVDKKAGDSVYAASINTTGLIWFQAQKVGSDTTLAQIIRLLEDAQGLYTPTWLPITLNKHILEGKAHIISKKRLVLPVLAVLVMLLVTACQQTDIVGNQSIEALDQMLRTIPTISQRTTPSTPGF